MSDAFNICMKEFHSFGSRLSGAQHKLHESVMAELFSLEDELLITFEAIAKVVDGYVYEDDKSCFKEVANGRNEFSESIHFIVKTVSDIFREEWIRDYDYESIYLNFYDEDNREGSRYVLVASMAIKELFFDKERDKYYNLIKLAFSESIEGNEEAAYSICQALGSFLSLHNYNLFYAAEDIISKIKEHKKRSLSKISSKRKHKLYEEVISLINATISKHPNASVDSLAGKVIDFYRQESDRPSHPPSKKTIVGWINKDIKYVPQKPLLRPNQYELVTS